MYCTVDVAVHVNCSSACIYVCVFGDGEGGGVCVVKDKNGGGGGGVLG